MDFLGGAFLGDTRLFDGFAGVVGRSGSWTLFGNRDGGVGDIILCIGGGVVFVGVLMWFKCQSGDIRGMQQKFIMKRLTVNTQVCIKISDQ